LDHAGHASGWGSQSYYDNLTEIDGRVSQIEEAAKAAGIINETLFVIAADHGGNGVDHYGPAWSKTLRQIPIIFSGCGVKPGVVSERVTICDIAPTILDAFGISTPSVWDGRSWFDHMI
jgi:arylsulfatase A-like enzyme